MYSEERDESGRRLLQQMIFFIRRQYHTSRLHSALKSGKKCNYLGKPKYELAYESMFLSKPALKEVAFGVKKTFFKKSTSDLHQQYFFQFGINFHFIFFQF